MYTAIRSLLMCEEIKQARGGGRLSYIGLANNPLQANSRPGVVTTCPGLMLETDGRPSAGRVLFVCEGLDFDFPIATPGGLHSTFVGIKLSIPILRVGELAVSVINTGEPGAHRLESRWGLDFMSGAKLLQDGAEEVILIQTRKVAARMLAYATQQL